MLRNKRLNVQVVCEALLLLAVTVGILAYFSHRTLRQEAVLNAEQTLEGTVQDIDNILISVEQSTGNIYYDLLEHLDEPDRMPTYARELVGCNPNIIGCAIAFKPGYYSGKDLFMTVAHRRASGFAGESEIVMSETFADRPYTEQVWFTEPMTTGRIGWIDPLKGIDTETEPLVSFCLPFEDKNNQRVGLIAVAVSINRLSKIILDAKPSEHGYSVLIAHNGAYIVHPDKEKLANPAVFSHMEKGADASELEAAKDMLAGETGMREFHRADGDWYVFFRPFERIQWEGRSSGDIGWSVGVVYPEEDIFGTHNILLFLILGIAVVGLLLFFLLCSWVIRRQLKPLKRLIVSTHYIAEGNYHTQLPYTDRQDEIGLLQKQFELMQYSLQKQVNELEEETAQLHQQGNVLRAAYDKIIETDDLKTSFLLYMTSQMSTPAENIDNSVTTLCNSYHDSSQQEVEFQVDNIQQKTHALVELLNHIAYFTQPETGKEEAYV
jgi:methyl-accepting chemotaxis protein